jgi:hypothetical protein
MPAATLATVSAQWRSILSADRPSWHPQPPSLAMAEIVNLRIARKRAARKNAESRAAEQRQAHGAPKRERELAEADRTKARRALDQHRIEPGDRR